MITKYESDDGTTVARVYHQAGTTAQGPDTRYAWTHGVDTATRAACDACRDGTIPASVKSRER